MQRSAGLIEIQGDESVHVAAEIDEDQGDQVRYQGEHAGGEGESGFENRTQGVTREDQEAPAFGGHGPGIASIGAFIDGHSCSTCAGR